MKNKFSFAGFSKNCATYLKNKFNRQFVGTLLSTIICIIIGLLIGIIVLLCTNPFDLFSDGIPALLFGGFENFEKVFYLTTPILLTGLSVAFANKSGLFNIGAPGQYQVGTIVALYFALCLHQNWFICILVAMVFGAIYGAIPGVCKAYFNVNEVITSIMLNWIALFLGNVFVLNVDGMYENSQAKTYAVTGDSLLPRFDSTSAYTNIGIIIGIIAAIILLVVLNSTKFGFQIKAVGFNRDASNYSGINTKAKIILTMAIAGALSALAGAMYYLTGSLRYSVQRNAVPQEGFNGIPVALLANNNPFGCIITAMFISYLQVGSDYMQPNYTTEVSDLVIAIIIYLSAFALFIKNYITKDQVLNFVKDLFNKIALFFKNLFSKKAQKEEN